MNAGDNAPRRSVQWIVWGALGLTIVGIALAYVLSEKGKPLGQPLHGERTASSLDQLPIITPGLPEFTLTNQFGTPVSAANFSNQVSVVDVVFTRCAGPCPEMTRRMSELQSVIPGDFPVKLVTVTTDPEYDTPAVLKRYADRYNANSNRWWFLTGDKREMARLAREGLKLVADETKPEDRVNDADLFVHSTVFVLLDKRGRLRGAIESTEPGFNTRVLHAVRQLVVEP
jgi:protein SCO1